MALSSFFPKTVRQTAFHKKGKGGKGNVKGGGKGQSTQGGRKVQSSQGKLTYECELCKKGYGSFDAAEGCEKRCRQQKTKGKPQMQSKPQIQNKPQMQKKQNLQNRSQFQSKPQMQSKTQLQTKSQITVNKPASTSPATLFECEVCNKKFHGRVAAEACERNCKATKNKQPTKTGRQMQSQSQLQTKSQINVNKPASTSAQTLFECEVCNKKFHGRVAAEACERNCKATKNAKKGIPANAKVSTANKAMYSCELCKKSFPLFQAAENCERACKAKRGNGGSFNNGKGAGKANVKATINKTAGNKFGSQGKTSAASQGAAGGVKCPKCNKSFSNKFVADGHIRACKK